MSQWECPDPGLHRVRPSWRLTAVGPPSDRIIYSESAAITGHHPRLIVALPPSSKQRLGPNDKCCDYRPTSPKYRMVVITEMAVAFCRNLLQIMPLRCILLQ